MLSQNEEAHAPARPTAALQVLPAACGASSALGPPMRELRSLGTGQTGTGQPMLGQPPHCSPGHWAPRDPSREPRSPQACPQAHMCPMVWPLWPAASPHCGPRDPSPHPHQGHAPAGLCTGLCQATAEAGGGQGQGSRFSSTLMNTLNQKQLPYM